MTAEIPIACTLDAGDYHARMRWISDLQARHLKSHRREGLTLHLSYPPAAADEVRDLVAQESKCCAFLAFELVEIPGEIALTITAPEEAAVASEEIFAGFLSGAGKTAACGCR